EPHHAIGVDGDAVRPPHLALAPRAEERAVTIEDDDRVLATGEAEDVVLRVHRHSCHLDEAPAVRELAPALDDLEVQPRLRLNARAPGGAWVAARPEIHHRASSRARSRRSKRRRGGWRASSWVIT